MRLLSHPQPDELSLPNVLHALSDPVRLAIVRELHESNGELSCSRLVAPVTKSTLSHHLKVLRDAGVTWTRAEGTQRLVSLRRRDLESRFPGLIRCILDGLRHSGTDGFGRGGAGGFKQLRPEGLEQRPGGIKQPAA